MIETKEDLRTARTQKLIKDTFFKLSEEKDFVDIYVRDITREAGINRTTFYHHFKDKYDLVDKVLLEMLEVHLGKTLNNTLNEDSVTKIFIALTNFQKALPSRCLGGYDETHTRVIKKQLDVVFHRKLTKLHPGADEEALKVAASILSRGIYDASIQWRINNPKVSPEEYIKPAIPYFMPWSN